MSVVDADRSRAWRQANPDKVRVQKRRHTLKYKERELARIIQWKKADPVRKRAAACRRIERTKQQFIEAYGGKCQCCGDTTYEFLTCEHLNGRGPEDRGVFGISAYIKARREGYPKDKYACLCMNCNFAKGKYGVCPHQDSNTPTLANDREPVNTQGGLTGVAVSY